MGINQESVSVRERSAGAELRPSARRVIALFALKKPVAHDAVVHGAFGFGRDVAFFFCVFATDLAAAAFTRARAALLAAARLSGDHGVYVKSG